MSTGMVKSVCTGMGVQGGLLERVTCRVTQFSPDALECWVLLEGKLVPFGKEGRLFESPMSSSIAIK